MSELKLLKKKAHVLVAKSDRAKPTMSKANDLAKLVNKIFSAKY